jgi:hypothetical protein
MIGSDHHNQVIRGCSPILCVEVDASIVRRHDSRKEHKDEWIWTVYVVPQADSTNQETTVLLV